MINNPAPENLTLDVTEIERFAIHDGPGIRTTVFLQGCPLACPWCSNPELRFPGVHLMHSLNRCVGCGMCAAACPDRCITMTNGRPVFDRRRCTGCGECAKACLNDAIRLAGKKMTVAEIMRTALRDRSYYRNSGGGVTVSGGEAFVQFDGLMRLLAACRSEGLHTAVETSGQATRARMLEAAPLVDLFLFDIKHTDPAMLKKHTGADAGTVLGNLRSLAESYPGKVIIRVPVVPGFNFDEKTITGIFTLALDSGTRDVHLLPYHTLGMDKYSRMGLRYMWPAAEMLTKNDLDPMKHIGEGMGLTVNYG